MIALLGLVAGCAPTDDSAARPCVELVEQVEFSELSPWALFDIEALSASETGRTLLAEDSMPASAAPAGGSRCTGFWLGSGLAVLRPDGSVESFGGFSLEAPRVVEERVPRPAELVAASGDLGWFFPEHVSPEVATVVRVGESRSEFAAVWFVGPGYDLEYSRSEMEFTARSLDERGELGPDWLVAIDGDVVRLEGTLVGSMTHERFQSVSFLFSIAVRERS